MDDKPQKRRSIKQHTTLFNPEYNYNHKVVQQKKQKEQKKRARKEVEQFLRTEGNENEQGSE